MLSQEMMDLASGTDQEVLQAELAARDAVLAERQAGLQAAHEAENDTRNRVPVLQELRAGCAQKLQALYAKYFPEMVALGPDCAVEDLAGTVGKIVGAIDLYDRCIDNLVLHGIFDAHKKVLTATVAVAEAMAQVADQERLVNFKQMSAALDGLADHGAISIVTERSESLDKYAAACWEKHALSIVELETYTKLHQRNLEARASAGNVITRANLPFAV